MLLNDQFQHWRIWPSCTLSAKPFEEAETVGPEIVPIATLHTDTNKHNAKDTVPLYALSYIFVLLLPLFFVHEHFAQNILYVFSNNVNLPLDFIIPTCNFNKKIQFISIIEFYKRFPWYITIFSIFVRFICA